MRYEALKILHKVMGNIRDFENLKVCVFGSILDAARSSGARDLDIAIIANRDNVSHEVMEKMRKLFPDSRIQGLRYYSTMSNIDMEPFRAHFVIGTKVDLKRSLRMRKTLDNAFQIA